MTLRPAPGRWHAFRTPVGGSPEPGAPAGRRTGMRASARTAALAAALLVLGGCGSHEGGQATSGVTGQVTLGPTCPVQSAESPCADRRPANVEVTVSDASGQVHSPGRAVARGLTDAEGSFRVAVPPGDYVVTARAGMSCEPVDARVRHDTFVTVTVACDTGIR